MTPLTLDEQHEIRSAKPWYPYRKEGSGQGDTLTGTVVALDSVWSDYQDGLRVIAVLREENGPLWSVRTYPTRLHDEWLRARPQIGERVSVKFTGMLERKKDGKEYPDFSIAVERETPLAFNYDRMGGPDDAAEPAQDYMGQVAGDAALTPSTTTDDPGPMEPATAGDERDDVPF